MTKLTLQDLNRISLALDDLFLPYTFDLSLSHHFDNEELLAHIGRVGKTVLRRQGQGARMAMGWNFLELNDLNCVWTM